MKRNEYLIEKFELLHFRLIEYKLPESMPLEAKYGAKG
jgi:hypothetical protein